jgi:hypothetical protein
VRAVSGFDYEKAQRVARWPLVEVLYAYLERVRDGARDNFHLQLLLYAICPPSKGSNRRPPQASSILKAEIQWPNPPATSR